MAVLISAFAVFTIPASAIAIDNPILPTNIIILTEEDDYYEATLTQFNPGNTYMLAIDVQQSGWRLIQTFGTSRARFQLLDSHQDPLLTSGSGFLSAGYDRNSLFQYNFEESTYFLKITPVNNVPIRLSITLADENFDEELPISVYEDIADFGGGYEQFEQSTPAKVWKMGNTGQYDFNRDGFVTIRMHVDTEQYAEAYFMDPSSNTLYDCMAVLGEGSNEITVPVSDTVYYIVLMTRWDGPIEANVVYARIRIEFVETETWG